MLILRLNILKKQNKNSSFSKIDYVLCDCKNLPFCDNFFNLAIDKGYLDSILKSANSPYSSAINSLENLLNKLDSCDNENNNYIIQITDEVPELRIDLFDRLLVHLVKNKDNIRFKFNYKEIHVNNQSYFVYYLYKLR